MAKKTSMTPNSRKVFDYLKAQGVGAELTTKKVMADLGFEKAGSVTGSITGLVKKGYAVREKRTVTDDEGKSKEISVFWLTEAGMNFDPDAVVEDAE